MSHQALLIIICFVSGFAVLYMLVMALYWRTRRPNWWNGPGRTSAPDPQCQRFPDWKVHKQ